MGRRDQLHLYRLREITDVAQAVMRAARALGTEAIPCEERFDRSLLSVGECAGTVTAYYSTMAAGYQFFHALAKELECVWLEARIQEGNHWEYVLQYPGIVLDLFSTSPMYFEEDELLAMAYEGRAQMLAKAWDIPVESIANYLVSWDSLHEERRHTKAYPTDKYSYGDYDQLYDFLRKLHYTTELQWFFELRL